MSDSFFKVRKGLTLEPKSGADPVDGTNGDIYYNSTLDKFRVFENGAWQDLGAGSGGSSSTYSRSGQTAILADATTVTVIFSSALPNANYVIITDMINTVDADPQFQTPVITNKTINGFTATWNAPTDSADYILSYIVPGMNLNMAKVVVPAGATSITTTHAIPYSDTLYSIVANLEDTTDGMPQFQPVVITQLTPTTFTATWNAPTDSANYYLVYQAASFV